MKLKLAIAGWAIAAVIAFGALRSGANAPVDPPLQARLWDSQQMMVIGEWYLKDTGAPDHAEYHFINNRDFPLIYYCTWVANAYWSSEVLVPHGEYVLTTDDPGWHPMSCGTAIYKPYKSPAPSPAAPAPVGG